MVWSRLCDAGHAKADSEECFDVSSHPKKPRARRMNLGSNRCLVVVVCILYMFLLTEGIMLTFDMLLDQNLRRLCFVPLSTPQVFCRRMGPGAWLKHRVGPECVRLRGSFAAAANSNQALGGICQFGAEDVRSRLEELADVMKNVLLTVVKEGWRFLKKSCC